MNFQQASQRVKTLDQKPQDNEMLQLYGLYKQATIGDINTERPSFWNLVGKAKWDSWESYKGLSNKSAENKYIVLVESLISKNEK